MLSLKTNLLLIVSLISLSVFANTRATTQYELMSKQAHEKMSIIDVKMNRLEAKILETKDNTKEEMNEQYKNLLVMKEELVKNISKAKEYSREKLSKAKVNINKQLAKLDKKLDKLTK